MKHMKIYSAVLMANLLAMSDAGAVPAPYPNPGTPNPITYQFTAQATGHVIAYFAGSTAGFTNTISLLVNGVDTGISGLNNQTSTYGNSLDFGLVHAGDDLDFRLNVLTNGDFWYSHASLNSDGGNHVYSAYYGGDAGGTPIPAGTYVAFEDLRFPNSDYNYHDENFVFTNVGITPSVPAPATLLLFSTGLGLMGFFKNRGKRGE